MNARDDQRLALAGTKPAQEGRAGQGASAPPARSQARASAARQRKLHVGHFAFMRSVVQGLDPRESWERYLRLEGEASDQRTVRATIAWIREEFAAAARRQDRYGTARLVRLDATRIPDLALNLPSLEAFAEARGLEDERQADQIAAFEAEYGRATQRLRRRARLITRQLEALRWLEGLVAQSPKRRRLGGGLVEPDTGRPPRSRRHLHAGPAGRAHQRRRPALVRRHQGDGAGQGPAHRRVAAGPRQHARAQHRPATRPPCRHGAPPALRPRTQRRGRPGHRHPSPGKVHRAGRARRQPRAVPASAGAVPAEGQQRLPGHPRLAALQARPDPGAEGAPQGAAAPARTPASSRAWTGCRRCRTPSAPTARKPSASCSGRSRTRARRCPR